MEKRLNSYILTDAVKEKMEDTLRETILLEKGFALCSRDKIIEPRGNIVGTSDSIIIEPEHCKGEKFLGGYHTHPKKDSNASALDLFFCGMNKITCVGGQKDNKIKCYTWKHEQLFGEELKKEYNDMKKDIMKYKSSRYKPNFDCLNSMSVLASREMNIKGSDKELDRMESDLLQLKKSGAPRYKIVEEENKINSKTEVRNKSFRKLIGEVDKESKKYYNEIEIK